MPEQDRIDEIAEEQQGEELTLDKETVRDLEVLEADASQVKGGAVIAKISQQCPL